MGNKSTKFTARLNDHTLYKKDAANFIDELGVNQLKNIGKLSLLDIFLSANNCLELHYHPNASELIYAISGSAEIGMLNADTNEWQTFHIDRGEVISIPEGWWHYVSAKNNYTHLLAIFDTNQVETIFGSDILRKTPKDVLAHLYCLDEAELEETLRPLDKTVFIGPPADCQRNQLGEMDIPSSRKSEARKESKKEVMMNYDPGNNVEFSVNDQEVVLAVMGEGTLANEENEGAVIAGPLQGANDTDKEQSDADKQFREEFAAIERSNEMASIDKTVDVMTAIESEEELQGKSTEAVPETKSNPEMSLENEPLEVNANPVTISVNQTMVDTETTENNAEVLAKLKKNEIRDIMNAKPVIYTEGQIPKIKNIIDNMKENRSESPKSKINVKTSQLLRQDQRKVDEEERRLTESESWKRRMPTMPNIRRPAIQSTNIMGASDNFVKNHVEVNENLLYSEGNTSHSESHFNWQTMMELEQQQMLQSLGNYPAGAPLEICQVCLGYRY